MRLTKIKLPHIDSNASEVTRAVYRKLLRPALQAPTTLRHPGWLTLLSLTLLSGGAALFTGEQSIYAQEDSVNSEGVYLSSVRQLTFEGSRAGEGYFSRDGKQMVFQSEREAGNPFYQIYLLDRETGDVERVSPGHGKTTCAWIHPDGDRVLFASTQFDPQAQSKQTSELEFRASGQQRRYAWDYDPQFELVEWNRKTGAYKKLTEAMGYDAEASYSPDGKLIAFSSNREAFSKPLTERQKTLFENDPAVALDLYVMNSDGSDVRRVTDVYGYDGGPFFSPDGKRLCWRRFSEDGATAEIYSANIDGSDAKQITKLGAMSWAPYFHPTGDYLIFATNLQGFANFELYLVDAAGTREPVRVTSTDGFDGLPVFTPDGSDLAWTSNRTADKKSQIFLGKWNDKAARKALGIGESSEQNSGSQSITTMKDRGTIDRAAIGEVSSTASRNVKETDSDYKASDIGRHVDYLCRPELGGRLTGTDGERLATAYVAGVMSELGLAPAGTDTFASLLDKVSSPAGVANAPAPGDSDDGFGKYFHPFPYNAGVELRDANSLGSGEQTWKLDQDWRPLAFSKSGEVAPTGVVFAGYGIVAPADGEQKEYDSYVHLDVENKWVMVLRQMPSDVTPERRQQLARYSSLRFKAMVARDRGAKGLIVVSGPKSGVRQQLVPLQNDGSLSGTSIAAVSISDELAEKWFEKSEDKLADLQSELDRGELMMGFELPEVEVAANIDVQPIKRTGTNVLGILRASDDPSVASKTLMIVGAHIDHLGAGGNSSSLAKEEEKNGVHRGADDNASGVAAMLEIAQSLASQKKSGKLKLKHDVLFAAWSGEELGLLGSAYFADHFRDVYPQLSEGLGADGKLYPVVIANLNLDMVGRLRENLVLQGIGSSPFWKGEIEKRNAVVGLPITLQSDSYLPTDASTFYLKGIPILSAFTGSHSEYHTPRDTPELLNYDGAAQIAKLMGLIARSLGSSEEVPEYTEQRAPEDQGVRAAMTAYLGSIPDYAQGDIQGVLLSGVSKDGPAAKAGVKAKDIVIELAGRKVENIYDYTYAIEALKVGQETEIVVKRGSETLRMKVTPQSRQ
jgi:Tol biopolymer transport system component